MFWTWLSPEPKGADEEGEEERVGGGTAMSTLLREGGRAKGRKVCAEGEVAACRAWVMSCFTFPR